MTNTNISVTNWSLSRLTKGATAFAKNVWKTVLNLYSILSSRWQEIFSENEMLRNMGQKIRGQFSGLNSFIAGLKKCFGFPNVNSYFVFPNIHNIFNFIGINNYFVFPSGLNKFRFSRREYLFFRVLITILSCTGLIAKRKVWNRHYFPRYGLISRTFII